MVTYTQKITFVPLFNFCNDNTFAGAKSNYVRAREKNSPLLVWVKP
jgi:hypothetical protein